MSRKEQIIFATLDLATKHGFNAVSMSQIAQKVGIQKPSLYNHFKSKNELVAAIYEYIRENAQSKSLFADMDLGAFVKDKSAEEALLSVVCGYMDMNRDEKLNVLYKVVYSERAVSADAAKILAEETKRMVNATKMLFYALQVHGKLNIKDIDTAALSFVMSVHAIMDHQLDCYTAGLLIDENLMQNYVKWFCENIGGTRNERRFFE